MANEEQLAILKQGVEPWNQWRQTHPDVRPDLREADLRRAHLERAHLSRAHLERAHLSQANLGGARLYESHLSRADLREAQLIGAYLERADLSWAKLERADLSRANLDGADLRVAQLNGAYFYEARLYDADLTEATVGSTFFANIDLSRVQGLETVKHQHPSTVGIDTLHRSNGQISAMFLRGCGVPDSWIEYLPSLIGALQPIQFYSCFISYSTKDEAFAKRLHQRMQAEHLRVWFAPEDIQGGKKIHEQLEEAIRIYDKLLVVLSERSIHSEWVTTEIYNARQAELQQGRRKLFPIRLVDIDTLKQWKCFDADTGKDLAREVREYHIPDFQTGKTMMRLRQRLPGCYVT